LEDITTKQLRTNRWKDVKRAEQEFKEANGQANFAAENSTKRTLEEIHQDTVIGFYIQELITSADHPHPWHGERHISASPEVSVDITVVPQLQVPEQWKRTTEIRTSSLILLRDLLQKSTEWMESNVLKRGLLRKLNPWEDTNRDAVLEQGYEKTGLAPVACCPRCNNKQAVVISGVRQREDPHGSRAQEQSGISQERYMDCFCAQCWSFQNFRHNKDKVNDWSFLKEALKDCKVQDPELLDKGLKGPIKDSEMQKIADHYLKNNKAPGPDSFQAELIKTMPPEQLKVIQQWLNDILATGEIVTEVTEEDMTGTLSLLHKGGPLADQPSHWRPVVLLNSMNQLLAYIINERLTEMVEHERILTQAQGGFRQNKSTDINACKLYGLTREAQRLKSRFLRVDIDFKSAFNSMSQASLWAILEAYGIPDIDLLKSLYKHTTVRLPERGMGSAKITFDTGVAQGSVLSPLLFSLFINALSRYLSDIGRKKRIHHGLPGTHPFNHILFADDMTLLAQDREGMQTLLDAIQEFEKWSGIPVNAMKTKQMTVDGIEANRKIIEELKYHGKSLPIAPESESVRYLGFWATPNGNMQAAKDLVYDRTLRAKEAIQGHPLDYKQAMATFSAKAVGNFRYLAAITPWRQRELDRLDRYWRQGFKTAWRLNEGTADHPWTTPKNMAGMGYTSTLAILSHALHAHIERCMKTEDVACQMMKNDLDRAMKDWRCTSKEELTAEAEARSWDETIDNVWLRMAMCDHLLEFKTWRQDDPKPLQGISYATATRHLRILRKRLEKLMGRSAQNAAPPWSDLPRRQWELLWQGETLWKQHGERLWDAGHKTVVLFRGASKTPLHPILRMAGDGLQTHHARVPKVKRVPASARGILQEYLNMVDWRHIQTECSQGTTKNWRTSPGFTQWQQQQSTKVTPAPEAGELVRSLIYEPPDQSLTEDLEEIKGLLKEGTPISWLRETLEEELWEEEQFQQGHTPPPPGLQWVWDQLSPLLQGQHQPVSGRTIRDWRLSLKPRGKRCSCQGLLTATCLGCGSLRCGVLKCEAFCKPCGTCQTAPTKVVLEPRPGCKKRKNMIMQPVALNLHSVGRHFVENITGIEEILVVDPELSEEEEQPLTDIRFRASVRGWNNKTHQSRAQTLLGKSDKQLVTTLRNDRDILLIPRNWWPDKIGSLEPEDKGWWYTVTEPVKFRVCEVCTDRRGNDLDEVTRAMHSRVCRGCAKMLQEPTKKGKKRIEGKGIQPVAQRVLRTRNQQARYNFSDDEEEVKEEIQGYLCVSADPRKSGQTEGGENFIITAEELRLILKAQCEEEDQTVWMTTAQAGFPTTAAEGELDNDLDRQLGKPTARCLHPAISAFIIQRQQDLVTQDQAPSMTEIRAMELESEWGTQKECTESPARNKDATEDITWEPDPLPLMANHPPRVTASNTKIQLDREGALSQICPKGGDDLGWVQLQQKSLLWQEMIEGSLVVTHEGLTTMAQSPRTGWTIMSGTWNHLRKVWGPTQDTLTRIQASCKDQESLEEANVFSPTRHLLLTLKRLWQLDRVHGLPAVAAPAFFHSASKGEECWWGTQDSSTVLLWDAMDDEDRLRSLETLSEQDNWVVWKTKDDKWSQELRRKGFHQLLTLNKNTRDDCWGNKIKGWWRRGDIKATKCNRTRECWVKSPANVPSKAARDIKEALLTPGKNFGKDNYTIDLTGAETTYWLGTESGLLGAFQFDGACTAGDGSCDVRSLSMGAGFCNLNSLKWLTKKPLTPARMHEQRSKQSHKVGREEEGMSSNRPELVALRECLEAHPDNENLLYLTDSEATLQAINKWIGGGAKLSLAKTADADVLKAIIVKLQQRVKAKAATLLIKVKAHRGCPLNEEADIRAEMGRLKQEKEKTWSSPTYRTIYQWAEASKIKKGVETTKQTAWTQAVRNRMRQKAGEIQALRAYEKGAEKWRREHMPRKGKGIISAEGQELLEDKETWGNETALRGAIHDSRKRERSNEDGIFMPHQKGPITSTFTADWFLREGQGRELLGEWMKKTAVRSQDQRRMLQANSHTFPTNSWIHKITKGRESDRCDLCRTLWIAEGRFRTEEELPKQTLGHIQHTCEALSAAHIDAHHQCWRLIHGELARLATPEWKFLCVSGEKCLQTIWDEITTDFEDMQYLNLTQETIWNAARAREMARPLKPAEHKRIQEGIPRETVMRESFWRMRPDGIAVLPPAGNKAGTFCILEHKRMSDCCEHYLVRAKKTAENQYASLRSAISTVIQRQGWKVDQVSFITGARSVDKQDFRNNLKFFGVPEASISSIYSKLAMRTFDVYANILKCMYSTRFNGGATGSEASADAQLTPCVNTALTHPISTLPQPDKYKRRKKESPKERDK
jgi:ribonuclease HI